MKTLEKFTFVNGYGYNGMSIKLTELKNGLYGVYFYIHCENRHSEYGIYNTYNKALNGFNKAIKKYFKNLINDMINQVGTHNRIDAEDRENILNYVGLFSKEVDVLINKFYDINKNIMDNGGAPVLKQILQLI
mgnify:CR=1 FL=1